MDSDGAFISRVEDEDVHTSLGRVLAYLQTVCLLWVICWSLDFNKYVCSHNTFRLPHSESMGTKSERNYDRAMSADCKK